MTDQKRKRLAQEKLRMQKKYGEKSADFGGAHYKLNVVPTGILALDYALGVGGWPLGHPVEIFGSPDIGKSSTLGLSALRSAQAQGLTCGIVALEPSFDQDWAIKHGVDPEWLIIGRPDDGQEAFEMTHEWLRGDLVDFIVFDSIGALLRPSETEEGGKPSQGGQSNLITWGAKASLMPCWKNNKGLMFLNQVRDDMGSRIPGMVESPGGWALKHSSVIRVHLKAGKDRYTHKVDGEDILIGRKLVANIKRNKLAEGTGQKAMFDFYSKEVEGFPFGVDTADDILNTAIRTGVIEKGGGWYRHPEFPGDKHQLQGKPAVAEFFEESPPIIETIRNGVLAVMLAKRKQVEHVPHPDELEEEDRDDES